MEREILFRGKRAGNGEWIFGYFVKRNEVPIIWENADSQQSSWIGSYVVDENTVCQYTGLKDKSGKKIFEGDILTINSEKPYVYVSFHNYQWMCLIKGMKYYRHTLENDSQKYEVIGNIFDNPELLGGIV